MKNHSEAAITAAQMLRAIERHTRWTKWNTFLLALPAWIALAFFVILPGLLMMLGIIAGIAGSSQQKTQPQPFGQDRPAVKGINR